MSDALTMRAALKQRLESAGYKVDSKLLAADIPRADNPDGVSVNGASKEQVQAVLADIARNATPDDVFILSYSGHGYTDATSEFYLLPSDLKGDCDHPDQTLQDSAISSEDLTQWIRPIDAGEMVMILDACYSAASIESNDYKPGPMGSSGLGATRPPITAFVCWRRVRLHNQQVKLEIWEWVISAMCLPKRG